MHDPIEQYWEGVKRILCYPKSTILHGLFSYHHYSRELNAYSDVDWTSSTKDKHSTGGYAIFLDQNLISWHSKMQPTISCSSIEAEYKVIDYATSKIIWLQSLLSKLHFSTSVTAKNGVIILEWHIMLQIQLFILTQDMRTLIFTLFKNV